MWTIQLRRLPFVETRDNFLKTRARECLLKDLTRFVVSGDNQAHTASGSSAQWLRAWSFFEAVAKKSMFTQQHLFGNRLS